MTKPLKNTTCFAEHEKRNLSCLNSDCRHHINYEDDLNCVMIAIQKWTDHRTEKATTQQDFFMPLSDMAVRLDDITRCRVWQLERRILKKLKCKLIDAKVLPSGSVRLE